MTSISGAAGVVVSCTPADVLSLIFMASVPDDIMTNYGYATFPRPSIHQSPLVLGRVCRLWREVSLATPQLWCKIQLGDMKVERYPNPKSHIHDGRDLGRDSVTLQEWLGRSGNCPLSIGICYGGRNESDMGLINKIIEVAILHVRRWKDFTLHSTPTVFSWNIILPLLDLQYLSMAFQDFLDCFIEIPSLKSLSLDVMEVPNELFRILQLSPALDQCLLPSLQHLTVTENLVDVDARTL
ncbi:hypothetical protein BD410DRAFT_901325 [Rickenella mellea]|uniref:F-box domain-containing protein n=1 Tax=Rickenella mellea TaxID=50990 RepID=A0A4Y7PRD3_9AGAM|nr:hypothetical protein BD410DRAFT_901325 [Rickenella mellea]